MAQHLSPSDLDNESCFERIAEIPYTGIKDFVLSEIHKRSTLLKVYAIAQLLAGMALFALVAYFTARSIIAKQFTSEIKSILFAGLFSITFLIPIHEGIHALAFIIKGKRDISFGAQWKKFLFYVESNRQVLNRKEMLFVALLPLVIVTLICSTGVVLLPSLSSKLFAGVVLLVHLFFCGGDLAIVSFFQRQLPNEVYTYDNRKEKKTIYFKKVD